MGGCGISCGGHRIRSLQRSARSGSEAESARRHAVWRMRHFIGDARSLSDIASLHKTLVARVLEGEGRAPAEIRRGAFANDGLAEPVRTFVDKVAHRAKTVTDADISTLRKAGLSEDEIYEIVVCAAIGQATRQYQTALAALSAATGRT